MTKTLAHDTYLMVLSESFPMNTYTTGFRWFFQNLSITVLWTKVAAALVGLKPNKILSPPVNEDQCAGAWYQKNNCNLDRLVILTNGLTNAPTDNVG